MKNLGTLKKYTKKQLEQILSNNSDKKSQIFHLHSSQLCKNIDVIRIYVRVEKILLHVMSFVERRRYYYKTVNIF